MNKSESIKELATALSKFQGEIKNPGNTADNPFFKSKYAPLNEILNVVRPILAKYGLSVIQTPSGDGQNIILNTTLIHSSGEWIESPELVLKADKATAQGAGSAITYARRYALSAILGISSEDDDDGNIAEEQAEKQAPTKKKAKEPTADNKYNELLTELYSIVKQKKYEKSIKGYIKKAYNKESSTELTEKEIVELIAMLNAIGE